MVNGARRFGLSDEKEAKIVALKIMSRDDRSTVGAMAAVQGTTKPSRR